jgi:hypothetical protein
MPTYGQADDDIYALYPQYRTLTGTHRMSALGHKRTWRGRSGMSAIPPKADVAGRQLDVRAF